MSLIPKKKLYAEARMAGSNIKDSAIAAGYSEETARQSGSRLEKDDDVRRYMGRLGVIESKPKAEKKPKEEKPVGRPAPALAPIPISAESLERFSDPLRYFERVMNDPSEDPKVRLEAAKSLAAYTIAKPGDKGKKEKDLENASKVASKFSNVRQLRPNA